MYIIGETSFPFLFAKFTIIYRINPNWIPVVIEYDNGIITTVKNAGIAINLSNQSILDTFSIIDIPTKINIGAIAAIGTMLTIGAKNNEIPKHNAADTAVNPVLPPASIPTLLSTYVVTLLVPNIEPITVVAESHISAFSKFGGISPFLSNLNIPDSFPVPINVPMVSNKSDITSVKIVIIITIKPVLPFISPRKSNLKKVGSIDGIKL